jgi:hypothetical protein
MKDAGCVRVGMAFGSSSEHLRRDPFRRRSTSKGDPRPGQGSTSPWDGTDLPGSTARSSSRDNDRVEDPDVWLARVRECPDSEVLQSGEAQCDALHALQGGRTTTSSHGEQHGSTRAKPFGTNCSSPPGPKGPLLNLASLQPESGALRLRARSGQW